MSGLSQIDARYDQAEDRIMLRLTTADENEYRLWFTRRVTFNVLTDFKEKTSQFRVSETVKTEKKNEELKAAPAKMTDQEAKINADKAQAEQHANTKYDEEFKPGKTYPLGEEGILVGRVDFKPNSDGGTLHSLSFAAAKGHGMTIKVNADIFNSILNVLEKTSEQAEWMIADNFGYSKGVTTLQ